MLSLSVVVVAAAADIGTKDSVARNLIKVVSADGSLLSNGRSEDRVSQDKHSRHSKASRVSSLASRDLVIDYESKSLKDHVSSIGSPGLAEEGSVFGSEIDGVNSNPIFTDAIVEVTETDGTKDDWGRFQLQNDSQFGSSVGNEHDNADALAEYELNMGSLLFQGGDYRAPYAELTNAVSKEVLSAEQSISGSAVGDSLFVFSPRDQKKFDDGEETAALKGFLTDAHSVRSVMSIDTEV